MASGGALEKAKKAKARLVQLMFSDVLGGIKSVTIPAERLPEALERGIWFDGSSIEGFARIAESDMFLVPDESTFAILPWHNGNDATARIICDVFKPDCKPLETDPRFVLKKTLEGAKKKGFDFMVGPELEFFLFRQGNGIKPEMHDFAGYFDFPPKDLAGEVRKDIVFALQSMGIMVEAAHHEVGHSQHEIDFRYGNALRTADSALTLKHVVKSIAAEHGLFASFMPKPLFGHAGSGMHVHQSLFNEKGENAFFDAKDKLKLGKTARHFIAGQLAHVKGMSAVLSPTVNSYKRLVPGYEAPVYICWGQINRSALIRIPRYSPGREKSTRAELRCPDPSCNPYIAFAVMLEAGLDGIEKELQLCEPLEESAYELEEEERRNRNIETLPDSLEKALEEMKKDKIVQKALGERLFEKYLAIKEKEWREYNMRVSEWELETYYPNT